MRPPYIGEYMDMKAANAVLSRVTYKPGWRFRLEDRPDALILCVSFRSEDATGKEAGHIEVQSRQPLPPIYYIRNEREFMQYIRGAIRIVEHHELDEWLQLDKHAPFYPH
jgi:hypothetical protein